MMQTIKDGGPAFPCEVDPTRLEFGAHQTSYTTFQQYGLSMRDYFAAKAMQLAFEKAIHNWREDGEESLTIDCHFIAEGAYRMADALLAAREVKP